MKREISLFSASENNILYGYERFRNLKLLLKNESLPFDIRFKLQDKAK